MSTAARKARKRSGEKFAHPVKVGTPRSERTNRRSLPSVDAVKTARLARMLEKIVWGSQ